jgi:hypothetical protein
LVYLFRTFAVIFLNNSFRNSKKRKKHFWSIQCFFNTLLDSLLKICMQVMFKKFSKREIVILLMSWKDFFWIQFPIVDFFPFLFHFWEALLTSDFSNRNHFFLKFIFSIFFESTI